MIVNSVPGSLASVILASVLTGDGTMISLLSLSSFLDFSAYVVTCIRCKISNRCKMSEIHMHVAESENSFMTCHSPDFFVFCR